ncbi:hypothetical protein BgAZ_301820 [Babesia gibsoni]|uniref:Uncharacterized protein n=1 Tax=Babesia gibsoni TaxID=33632 RepID=A0AAD8LI63_BABGI|nr:hypothetical protein BgAZ_301820 [Babesia gibsoni]
MDVEISGPYNELSTEDLEIMDDVVQSFCEAVDVVLKTNFKSQKRDASHLDSVSRNLGGKTEAATKNQKIAAVFCRHWLAGVLSELTHKLVDDTSDRSYYEDISKRMSPHLLDDSADIPNVDEIGVCVENARICGNGQVEVNYELDPSEVPEQLKPKLKTQELAQLILQGKQTEQDMVQKLENFWCNMPSLLSQHLSRDDGNEEAEGGSDNTASAASENIASSPRANYSFAPHMAPSAPIDDVSLEFLEKMAEGIEPEAHSEIVSYDIQHKLQQLKEKAEELGVKGMDTYISLYNKVNEEVTNINKMAKFFSKLANDFTASQD